MIASEALKKAGDKPAAAKKRVVEVSYAVGDQVTVIDGPFATMAAVVSDVEPTTQKLTVLVPSSGATRRWNSASIRWRSFSKSSDVVCMNGGRFPAAFCVAGTICATTCHARTIALMASKGKPSPRSAVKPLSNAQVSRLAKAHTLVDPMHDLPTGPDRTINEAEIAAQNPKGTSRLLKGVDVVFRASCRTYAWGLDNIPETGPFITAATHVTMFDVFVPMASLFHMGRRPRYMAKAEMAHWPLIGKWFQIVGMQPVQRRSGKARAIEETSVEILTSGRPLTVWPEGTVTRDPKKWPMSMKNGVGVIALEASRRLGYQVPLFCAVTWGAASINTVAVAAQERRHVLRRAAGLR